MDVEKVGYVFWASDGEDVILSFALDTVPMADRARRLRTACDLFSRTLEKASGIEEKTSSRILRFRLERANGHALRQLVTRLEWRISKIFSAPLTPKAVDEALGISSRERLRWYKDGRLPTCGRSKVGEKEHLVQIPLFPAEAVERLRMQPEIIEAWRREDEHENLRPSSS